MEFKFEIIKEAKQMDVSFHLVKQLTPEITVEAYTQYINEMVERGYYQVIVRNDEDNVIGVTGIWIATKLYCGKYMEMDNVVVDEKYRSVGLGKQLYEYCLSIANENNCKVIMLDAYRENIRAHDFYEGKGFIKRGFHFIKKL